MTGTAPWTGTVGILGAGRAGTALARALQRVRIPARIASTRSPAAMRLHLAQYAPQATAVPAEQIGHGTDLVVLMVPQEELDTVDPSWVAGSVLLDATNRWEDEPLPDWFEDALQSGLSSSEAVAAHFRDSTVVKTFNHLSHWDLEDAGERIRPVRQPVRGPEETTEGRLCPEVRAWGPVKPEHPDRESPRAPGSSRRALALASDDGHAASSAAHLISSMGFDPLVLPSLGDGRVLEPGGPVFNRSWTAAELIDLLRAHGVPASDH